jgi:hypothetical protein
MDRSRLGRGLAILAVAALAVAVVSPAFSAATLTKAKVKQIARKQATKVFNTKSTGLQAKCTDGTVLAWALVDELPGPVFSTEQVIRSFNCMGGPIEVRFTGFYQVRVPGITTPSIQANESLAASVTVAEDTDNYASYLALGGDDFISVRITDGDTTNPTQSEFTIAIYNVP